MAKKRKIAFVGSECYPFVKTGGLGDVMYALPRALLTEGCEVRVILPLYACIPQKFKEKMEYKGSFMMDQTSDGRTFFVGIMELEQDGVIYDFVSVIAIARALSLDVVAALMQCEALTEVLLFLQGSSGNPELSQLGSGHYSLPRLAGCTGSPV